jgi:hypothetical protein
MIIHLIIMCALILLGSIVVTFFAPQPVAHGLHQYHHHPKCTQLWIYTYPVQKGPCVVFQHPSGHELEKANRANIEFNRGVEAGHLRTLTFNSTSQLNCPSGNTKEFCSGWKSATQFTLQQYKSSHHILNTTLPKHVDCNIATSYYKQWRDLSVFCTPVRLPSLVWYNWCIW